MKEKDLICKVKGGWLISWEFHSPDKSRKLKELGINNEIIDILDSHKNFGYVLEYTKNVYKLLVGDHVDKVLLAKRGKNRLTEKEFFCGKNCLFTHYQTDIYRKLIKITETKGLKSPERKKILEEWINYPQYIFIGHNPSIHARKVRDVKVYKNSSGKVCLEWKEPLAGGGWKNENYISG